MGRLTRQIDGTTYDRAVTYNAKGQITNETVITKQGTDTYKNIITNQYGSGSGYALGQVTQSDSDNYKNNNDSDFKDTRTTNAYAWYDGGVTDLIQHDRAVNDADNSVYYSDYTLSASGVIKSVFINDGRDRTVSFTNDMGGQVIRRDELDNNSGQGDPHGIWYRFNGREMATSTNQPTPAQLTYGESVTDRGKVPPFRHGERGIVGR